MRKPKTKPLKLPRLLKLKAVMASANAVDAAVVADLQVPVALAQADLVLADPDNVVVVLAVPVDPVPVVVVPVVRVVAANSCKILLN
jgi:urease accessory protein UreE